MCKLFANTLSSFSLWYWGLNLGFCTCKARDLPLSYTPSFDAILHKGLEHQWIFVSEGVLKHTDIER